MSLATQASKDVPAKVTVTKEDAIKKGIESLMKVVKDRPVQAGRSGTGADNAKFGTVNKTGKVTLYEHACHAQLRYEENLGALVVYSSWGKRPESDINYEGLKMFFDWIRSDDGPWRTFEGRNVSHVPKDWDKGVLDFIWEYGWVWSDVDKYPSNLQHSFLTVSRMAPEWPKLINKWHEWVLAGCDKALAFLFIDIFRPVNDVNDSWGLTDSNLKVDTKKWQLNRSNRYDWPLDACTATEDYVRNFINGHVEALNKPYAEDQNYRPVNRIFGNNEIDCMDKSTYPSVLFQLYASTYGPGEEKCKEVAGKQSSLTVTEFQYERHWFISESEAISIIKQESERLYGKSTTSSDESLSSDRGSHSPRDEGTNGKCRDDKERFIKVG